VRDTDVSFSDTLLLFFNFLSLSVGLSLDLSADLAFSLLAFHRSSCIWCSFSISRSVIGNRKHYNYKIIVSHYINTMVLENLWYVCWIYRAFRLKKTVSKVICNLTTHFVLIVHNGLKIRIWVTEAINWHIVQPWWIGDLTLWDLVASWLEFLPCNVQNTGTSPER